MTHHLVLDVVSDTFLNELMLSAVKIEILMFVII